MAAAAAAVAVAATEWTNASIMWKKIEAHRSENSTSRARKHIESIGQVFGWRCCCCLCCYLCKWLLLLLLLVYRSCVALPCTCCWLCVTSSGEMTEVDICSAFHNFYTYDTVEIGRV